MIEKKRLLDHQSRTDPNTNLGGNNKSRVIFPVGCLYPSVSQMHVRLPSENSETHNPLPLSPIYIDSKPQISMRVFNSKDKPCMLTFGLTNGSTEGIIFKLLKNSSPEALCSNYLAATFFTDQDDEKLIIDPAMELLHPGEHAQQALYRVTPLKSDMIAVQVLNSCKPLQEYCLELGSNSSNNETKLNYSLRQGWNKLFAEVNYLKFEERVLCLSLAHGFCSSMHLALGLGDRNFQNIMITNDFRLVNIDLEMILGAGKSLPVPEISELRVGPFFEMLTGSLLTKSLFLAALTIYTRKIFEERYVESIVHFSEFMMHRNEAWFFQAHSEQRTQQFFEELRSLSSGDAKSLVNQRITFCRDEGVKARMFTGLKPDL